MSVAVEKFNMEMSSATKRFAGTEVYIDIKRKRFVVMDYKSREMWAKEYFTTETQAKSFCDGNGFIVIPKPNDSLDEVSELITIVGQMIKWKAFGAAADYTEQLAIAFASYRARAIVWSIEDFEGTARERELLNASDRIVEKFLNDLDKPLPARYVKYDRTKFTEALESMIKHHDATSGISYDTIRTVLDLECKI